MAAVHTGHRSWRCRPPERVDKQRRCTTARALVPVQHVNIVREGSPGEPRVLEDDDNLLGFRTRQYRQRRVGWDFCEAVLPLVPIVNEVLRGLVSGDTSISQSSAAIRCAPLFIMKVSSVQVSPERNVSTGTFVFAACGGTKTANRMSQLLTEER